MVYQNSRYAPYKVKCRNQLQFVNVTDQRAFARWQEAYIKDSKYSNQDSLPSSQLPRIESIVQPGQKQLFVLIDTCSLVKYQAEFIDFVIRLRNDFRGSKCPIRFIIPLVVLEELDKCNRKPTKKRRNEQGNQMELISVDDGKNPPIDDVLNHRDPPRSFMRIVEEELRTFEIIVPDLDPRGEFRIATDSLSLSINDNRILSSCLRSQRFIESLPHHVETRVILVTEDNNFKTKATTFRIASFRWREFFMKYRNFGKRNCAETPLLPSKENTRLATVNGHAIESYRPITTPKLQLNTNLIKLEPLAPFSVSQESVNQLMRKSNPSSQSTLGKLLPTKMIRRQVSRIGQSDNIRTTSLTVKCLRKNLDTEDLLRNMDIRDESRSGQDEVVFIEEVITVD